MKLIKNLIHKINWPNVIKRIVLIILIHILTYLLHLSWIPEKYENQ